MSTSSQTSPSRSPGRTGASTWSSPAETPISELMATFVELGRASRPTRGAPARLGRGAARPASRCRWTARSPTAGSPTARCWR